MPLTIRAERPDDFDAIARVVAAAFKSQAEADLVAAIRASEHYVAEWALVAELDGEIVGHVMLSYSALHGDDGTTYPVLQLSPLAVAPEHHSEGIGSDLVRTAAALADATGEPMVILQGDPRYYGRFGFEPAAAHGIVQPLPDWAPPEASQILRLAAYRPALRGRVVYPPAFDGVE